MSNITNTDKEILFRQSRLSMGFFMFVIMFMTSVQWMTLDMYLPALPALKNEFNTTEEFLNISLNAGIYCSAVGMLFGGMLSDKFGRKSTLIVSILSASLFTLLAALSTDVLFLSLMRGLAGLGSGCIQTVTAAVLRDSYDGNRFRKSMSLMQAFGAAGPIVSPAIGSFFVSYMSWRWIFIFLGAATLICIVPIAISDETWPKEKRIVSDMKETLLEMVDLAREIRFMVFLIVIFILTIPMWSYLAVSSYVFFDYFSVSNISYSILYAAGCAFALTSAFIFLGLSNITSLGRIIWLCAIFLVTSCVTLHFFGATNPVVFLICLIPLILTEGISRSLGMVVALDAHPQNAGAASSLVGFGLNMVGGIGTSAATAGWNSFITGLSVICLACAILATIFFIIVIRRGYYRNRLWTKEN